MYIGIIVFILLLTIIFSLGFLGDYESRSIGFVFGGIAALISIWICISTFHLEEEVRSSCHTIYTVEENGRMYSYYIHENTIVQITIPVVDTEKYQLERSVTNTVGCGIDYIDYTEERIVEK